MGPLTPRNPRLRTKYPYNDMVWKKLDPDTKGFAEIKQVIKYADDVEMCCPGLVDRFQEVAKNGKLTKDAFDNYGKPTDRAKHRAKRAKRHDLGELRQLFDTIVKAGEKDIKLADLVRHKREVNRICPELITEFSDIDQDNSCSVSWDELRVFAGGTDDWLKFQLQNIIGLDGLKDQIHQFHQSISLDKKRQAAGFDVKDAGGKYHMIFQGNPGTGKTTMGRVVAALLKRIGITQSDLLVEVQRDQLVAGYVGQTAPKTQEKIDEACAGVLFVDEAYRLSHAVWKSNCRGASPPLLNHDLTPSTRRHLNGVAVWVLHDSIQSSGPHAPDTLADFHTGTARSGPCARRRNYGRTASASRRKWKDSSRTRAWWRTARARRPPPRSRGRRARINKPCARSGQPSTTSARPTTPSSARALWKRWQRH